MPLYIHRVSKIKFLYLDAVGSKFSPLVATVLLILSNKLPYVCCGCIKDICQLWQPHFVRLVLSSTTRILVSWVGIPLEAWLYNFLLGVCVVLSTLKRSATEQSNWLRRIAINTVKKARNE
jgi:hypothetical protein